MNENYVEGIDRGLV